MLEFWRINQDRTFIEGYFYDLIVLLLFYFYIYFHPVEKRLLLKIKSELVWFYIKSFRREFLLQLSPVQLFLLQSALFCWTPHSDTSCTKVVFGGGLQVVFDHSHHPQPLPLWYFSSPATSGLKRNFACGLTFPHYVPHSGNWQLKSLSLLSVSFS